MKRGNGRRPKPTILKLLYGEKNKDRINKNEPKPIPIIEIPPCPDALDGEARKEWERQAPELVRIGLLTKIDVGVFVMMCQAWGNFIESISKLKKHGLLLKEKDEKIKINPYHRIMQENITQYLRIAVELGLTPSARSKISIKKTEQEDNEFKKLLTK